MGDGGLKRACTGASASWVSCGGGCSRNLVPGGSQGVCGGGGGRGGGQKVLPERAEFWASSWFLLVTAQRPGWSKVLSGYRAPSVPGVVSCHPLVSCHQRHGGHSKEQKELSLA